MAHNEDHHRERFEDEEGISQAEVIRRNEILFSYLPKNCPNCGTRLREYRRDRKLVRTLSGEFTAVHKIMMCPREKREYRSEKLFEIVPKRCRYSNDVMVESAIERFIT